MQKLTSLLALICLVVGVRARAEAPDFCQHCTRAEIDHWVRHYVAEPPLLQALVRQQAEALERAEFVDCRNTELRERTRRRMALESARNSPPGVPGYGPLEIVPEDLLARFLTRYRPFREAVTSYFVAARRFVPHQAALNALHSARENEYLASLGDDEAEQAEAARVRSQAEYPLRFDGLLGGISDLQGPLRAVENSLLGIFPRGLTYQANAANAQASFSSLTLWQMARMRVELRMPLPAPHQAILICGPREISARTSEQGVSLRRPFVHTLTSNQSSFNGVPQWNSGFR